MIRLDVDGPWHDPHGYVARLAAASADLATPDSYGIGAVVQNCEAALAKALGKERAVLFATGSLANLLALDRLCQRHARRVLVHPDSHVLNDVGDAAASVGGLTLVPAPSTGAGFAAAAITDAITQAATGRVAQALGAVSVETPVRRLRNAAIPRAERVEVEATARAAGLGLHLDGARLSIAAAAEGVSMAAFATPYDTVYVSLWKLFGLPFGAALAGSAALLDGIEHDRRRHGGALPQLWPLAAVVSAELPALEPQWVAAFAMLDQLDALLANAPSLTVERIGDARTNTRWLTPKRPAAEFVANAKAAGLALGETVGERVLLRANTTWLATSAEEIAAKLIAAA